MEPNTLAGDKGQKSAVRDWGRFFRWVAVDDGRNMVTLWMGSEARENNSIAKMIAVLGSPNESQSKPGIKMVYPEQCTGLRRRPQLFMVGIAPY